MRDDVVTGLPRVRRWPWVLLALLVVLVLVGTAVAAVTGRVLPYRADREELRGTPFVMRTQGGVPFDEEDRVRAGLVAVDAYLDEVVGAPLDDRAEVRVTWSQPCDPLLGPDSGEPAWAEDGLVCLNAHHPGWRGEVDRHVWFPAYAAAREAVHLWQASLGCAGLDDGEWLADGMAQHLAFEALRDAGIVTRADARSHADGRGGEDHRAVRQLAEGAPGVAAFADFCTATGEGLAWADAFRDAFGLAPDELAGDPGADATA